MELTDCVKRRGSIKAKITVFGTFLTKLAMLPVDENAKLDENIRSEIQLRLERAKKVLDQYDDIQESIDSLTDDAKDNIDYRSNFESEYFAVVNQAKSLLARGISTIPDINTQQRSNIAGVEANAIHGQLSAHNNNKTNVKLPIIELPKFGGDLSEWLGFRDTFESLINKNNSIEEIEKFHYLKAALSGSAGQIVRSLEFSAANYAIAWESVCNRYNSKKLLIHNHIRAIFEMQAMKRESSEEIQAVLDTVLKNLRALCLLGEDVKSWDSIMIYILAGKLEVVTLRDWEREKAKLEKPKLMDMTDFLAARSEFLQTLEVNNNKDEVSKSGRYEKRPTRTKVFLTVDKRRSCILCSDEHYVPNCSKFLEMNVQARAVKIRELKACLNCLRKGHFANECRFAYCKKCQERHNTLLHFERASPSQAVSLCTANVGMPSVMLATALFSVQGQNKIIQNARAILDSCSQSNFITNDLCDILMLKKSPVNVGVETLHHSGEFRIKHKCELELVVPHNSLRIRIACLVIPKIAGQVPQFPIDSKDIDIPPHLKLADPSFNMPGKIDLLLGAEWFWRILCVGQISVGSNGLIMQKTKIGWVVSGPVPAPDSRYVHCNLTRNIDEKIQKFWELEEISKKRALSREERECESIFLDTHKRDADGRFIVTIPLKLDPKKLGDSRGVAEKRLISLERRFKGHYELKRNYEDFLLEYERMGHMSRVEEAPNEIAYYLPHHCVIKSNSLTTKTRVVFDGSAATSTGVSLNDIQMVGPTIQNSLFDILLRSRKHSILFVADIAKMYRQVLINPSQRSLQRILWRSNPDEPIKVFNLNTVTYGTVSASFLAIRAFAQLAYDCALERPEVAKAILNDFYVDDLLSGSDSIEDAKRLAHGISRVLAKGCFSLPKWYSNEKSVIRDLMGSEKCEISVCLADDGSVKTLGLNWNSHTDTLKYVVQRAEMKRVTKRQMLSEVAQLFDPLGLLGPVIVVAKILLQRLWLEKLSWDESLPAHLHTEWLRYRKNLLYLNAIEIPRHVVCKSAVDLQLHGFADASKSAYGACIYARSVDSLGNITVRLLCSKSRVAPLKVKTIPRLELCGAVILTDLMSTVLTALDAGVSRVVYWTDSSIVLAWLKLQPNLLSVFVSNRVSLIQESCNIEDWLHVPTKFNPADVLSRGIDPSELAGNKMWWYGPEFLAKESKEWPESVLNPTTTEEVKIANVNLHVNIKEIDTINTILNRCSTLNKSCRVLAYVIRFVRKLRRNNGIKSGALQLSEKQDAFKILIKRAQHDSFSAEIKALSAGETILKGKLSSLAPFLDEENLLRVGGRLLNSDYGIDKKFPMVISSDHRFTSLVMEHEHRELMHAGPQLLLASTRERFWPIGGRNLARKIVKGCTVCFRANPVAAQFNMGNLPNSRVSQAYPFFRTGVDYAGPFLIKNRKGRGCKLIKCYACLFVCFTTKAVHIEIVSDLSTEAFVSTLRRFVSRRGKPAHIYSDNGTTFVGAKNELNELGQFLVSRNSELGESIESIGVKWHFIPPRSPHFGGLWEAGVRSVKFHIKRIAGHAHLLYEEFYTLLVQIESILNSRPLSPLSSDPNDLMPLTPAHFLIGRSLLSISDPDLRHIKEGRLSNWQRVQQIQQHYWERWNKEYISELQRITKWKAPFPELQIGALVLLKEDNLPPSRWRLGRVVETFRGKDNVVRVASIRTSTGNTRRALTKLCPLPNLN